MVILIVDDKQENVYLLESLLKGNGYKTIPARNGAEALGLARKETPDLIISDILMPVMDGYTLCRECKKDEKLGSIPFVFYTATYTDPKDEEFALSLGASKFVLKPQDPDIFLQIINDQMKDAKKKKDRNKPHIESSEVVILKEYNQTLIRKLEDKMVQTEENEKKVKKYVQELEASLEERKKTETALRESEERYRLVQENSLDGILLTALDGGIISANKAACEMFQMTEEELCRLGRDAVVDAGDPRLNALFEERRRTGRAKGEITLQRKDKTKFQAEISSSVFTDSDGEVKSSMIVRDITERKKAEEILKQHEQQLVSIYNTVGDVIFYIAVEPNEQFRFISVNNAFTKVTGVPADVVIGKLVHEVIPRQSVQMVLENYRAAIKNKDVVRWEETSDYPNGRLTGVVTVAPVFDGSGNCKYLVGSVHDITERHLAQKALRESEIRFKTIFMQSPLGVAVIDSQTGDFYEVNPRFAEITGRTIEELIHIDWKQITHPDDVQADLDNMALLNAGKVSGFQMEKRYIRPDGTIVWIHMTIASLRVEDHISPRHLCMIEDITERKKSERELLLQNAAFQSAANAIVITDLQGTIVSANHAFTTLTGYAKEEVIGRNPNVIKSGKHDSAFYKDLWETILSGQPWTGELVNKRKDGELYNEEMTITPVRQTSGEISHFIAVKQDITERKKLQEQLTHMQRMESVGTLASGIAHDFNNILGIILMYMGLVEKVANEPEKLTQCITAINDAVRRGADLVKQILTFARKSQVQFGPIDVNIIIKEIGKMLRETITSTIEVTYNLHRQIPLIMADATQLHQSILNLCVNARDAMGGHGKLHVKSSIVDGAQLKSKFNDVKDIEYICISVGDTGTGIEKALLGKIFDPFFTTKEPGKGTGLGLSVVYGVMKKHNGFIDVESEVGKGTTFSLYFPIIKPYIQAEEQHVEIISEQLRGTEKILFIEDEESLRKMAQIVLEDLGYTIMIAKNGLEGVEMYKKNMGSIDVVVSDMGLPNMSGVDLFLEMHKLNPSLSFIIASGYVDQGLKSELFKKGMKAFIQKPYDGVQFVKTIRDVLDKK